MKNLIEKIKTWILSTWLKLKTWFIKNWFVIINYVIIFVAYNIIYGHEGVAFAEVLLALWMLVSVAYGTYNWLAKTNDK